MKGESNRCKPTGETQQVQAALSCCFCSKSRKGGVQMRCGWMPSDTHTKKSAGYNFIPALCSRLAELEPRRREKGFVARI